MHQAINEHPSIALVIKAAYEEGFGDGRDHGNLDYKYPPCDIAWLLSDTRKMELGLEFDRECQAKVSKWRKGRLAD